MEELIGRLTPLDPAATETLKIVTYFDALMSAGLGVDALARAAASMAATVAGVRTGRKTTRFDPDGKRLPDSPVPEDRLVASSSGAEVWLERAGPAHANDAMLLERLSLAVTFALRKESPSQAALDVALDASRPAQERALALERLGIAPGAAVRVVVAPVAATRARPRATTALTSSGVVAVLLAHAGEPIEVVPCGVGPLTPADDLPGSFRAAELAFRLTGDSTPVVCADDFGLLLVAAGEMLRTQRDHPDVQALAGIGVRHRRILAELIEAPSVRAAAAALNMHHSTLQTRQDWFSEQLGYDPRSARGRARYELADLVLRLAVTPAP